MNIEQPSSRASAFASDWEAEPTMMLDSSHLFMEEGNPEIRDSLQLEAKCDHVREMFGSAKLNTYEVIQESKDGWIASPPQILRPMHMPDSLAGASSFLSNSVDDNDANNSIALMNPMYGFISIADALASRALPWQALHCPRALEFVNKLRNTISTERYHIPLLNRLSTQIHENVASFSIKKDLEFEAWRNEESTMWLANLDREQQDCKTFFSNWQELKQERRLQRKDNQLNRESEFARMVCEIERNDAKEIVESYKGRFNHEFELTPTPASSIKTKQLVEKHLKLRDSMR